MKLASVCTSRAGFGLIAFTTLLATLALADTSARASCVLAKPTPLTSYADGVSYGFATPVQCTLDIGESVRFSVWIATTDRSRARGQGYANWRVASGDPAGLSPGVVNAGAWPNINADWPRFTRDYTKSGVFTATRPGVYEVRAGIDFPYATYVPYANKNLITSRTYRIVVTNQTARNLVGKTFVASELGWTAPTAAEMNPDLMPEGVLVKFLSASEDGQTLTAAFALGTLAEAGWIALACVAPVALGTVHLGVDGAFVSDPVALDAYAFGTWVGLEDFQIAGTADVAGTQLANLAVSGRMDAASGSVVAGFDHSPFVASVPGEACVPCAAGACAEFLLGSPAAAFDAGALLDPAYAPWDDARCVGPELAR